MIVMRGMMMSMFDDSDGGDNEADDSDGGDNICDIYDI